MLLRRVCALMDKNLTSALYVFCSSSCSFQHLPVDVFLNLTVFFLEKLVSGTIKTSLLKIYQKFILFICFLECLTLLFFSLRERT